MADAAMSGGMAIPVPERKSLWQAFVAAGSLVRAIVFARVAFGAWFLYHEVYYEKISHWTSQTLPTSWNNSIKNPDVAHWYKSILTKLLPHAAGFRVFLTSWEIIFGICLVFGLGIRTVTILQMFANLNYILSKSYLSGGANLDRLALIVLITLCVASAGRYFGLDGWLKERYPRTLAWL
ncbi:MAG: hypothetical protein ACR2JW_03175 [Thermomicrobiales bacterium]